MGGENRASVGDEERQEAEVGAGEGGGAARSLEVVLEGVRGGSGDAERRSRFAMKGMRGKGGKDFGNGEGRQCGEERREERGEGREELRDDGECVLGHLILQQERQ